MINTQGFIKRAIAKHGNKYDYSKVEYVNIKLPVCISCPIHGEFWQSPENHLRSRGCPECNKLKKPKCTIEEFISKARAVHGWKYDYSESLYKDCNTKIKIICPIHGAFWQRPSEHLRGKGCSLCVHDKKRMTVDGFIKRAKEIYEDKYDYSKVDYKTNRDKVCIICPKHGEFWQYPASHLQGHGCAKCSGKAKYTTDIFVAKAQTVHGLKYDYSKSNYLRINSAICIICPEHGEFWQTPSNHLNGSGCPKCANKRIAKKRTSSQDSIIRRFNHIHGDKYDYSLVDYKGLLSPIRIICPEHGEFLQTPRDHLDGHGCTCCSESHGERRIAIWLTEHNIDYIREYWIEIGRVLFGRKRCRVDFYIPKNNAIIEYHGKQHYERVPYFHKTEEQFADQQDRDRRLREYCKQHKIRLIEIPYSKIDEIEKILSKKLA